MENRNICISIYNGTSIFIQIFKSQILNKFFVCCVFNTLQVYDKIKWERTGDIPILSCPSHSQRARIYSSKNHSYHSCPLLSFVRCILIPRFVCFLKTSWILWIFSPIPSEAIYSFYFIFNFAFHIAGVWFSDVCCKNPSFEFHKKQTYSYRDTRINI